MYFKFVIDVTNRSTPLADNHISELSFHQEVIRRPARRRRPDHVFLPAPPLAPLAPPAPPTSVVRSAAAVTQSEAVYSVAQILHGKVFLY